jgi:Zn-dependent peptidase ImmA (M78 family)
MNGRELAEKVVSEYGTSDVFELAQRAGCKVVYARWQPVTLGEYHIKTKTICINENAQGNLEHILAHELGHFFYDTYYGCPERKTAEQIAEDFSQRLLRR